MFFPILSQITTFFWYAFMKGSMCFVGRTTCHGDIYGQNMPPCFLFYTAATPHWHLDVKTTMDVCSATEEKQPGKALKCALALCLFKREGQWHPYIKFTLRCSRSLPDLQRPTTVHLVVARQQNIHLCLSLTILSDIREVAVKYWN